MVSLKDAIRSVGDVRLGWVPLTEISRVQSASDKILSDNRREGFREGRDYNEIAARIASLVNRGEALDRKTLADAVWCLWSTTPALAEESHVLDELLRQIQNAARPRLVRSLCAAFLTYYREELPGIKDIARFLARTCDSRCLYYYKLHNDLEVFDIDAGADLVAETALEAECAIPDLFRQYGLGASTAMGGFAAHCTQMALEQVEVDGSLDGFERVDFAKRIAVGDDDSLIFEVARPYLANALLRPYGNGNPDKAESDKIVEFLTSIIGDPRIHPGRWSPMPDAEAVMLRWLTEQTLRQFLDIVDRVADRNMWRYRRKFWEAVHARGLIDTAWVVFDSDGANEARARFGRDTKFGRFSDHVETGQAALMLEMGSSLVVEWSHNGRCHIWSDKTEGPKLFNNTYSPKDLRASRSGNVETDRIFSQGHRPTDGYTWQGKVARKLQGLTGVRISQAEYRID